MKNILLSITSLLLIAASCNPPAPTPYPTPDPKPDPTPVKKEMKVEVADIADGTVFGFFAKSPVNLNNVRMTVKGGAATSGQTLYWADDQSVSSDFVAYYPYSDKAALDKKYDFQVSADQTDPADYAASDFMMAGATAKPDQAVRLEFAHSLSKVSFSVVNNLEEDIASIIFGNVATKVSVDLSTFTASAAGEPSSVSAGLAEDIDGTFKATVLVPSQTVRPAVTIISASGKEYLLEVPEEKTFPAGMQTTLSFEVNPKTQVLDLSATVTDWNEGWYIPVSQDVSKIEEISLSEFVSLPADNAELYRISGKISGVTDNVKGSFALVDDYASVQVVSLLSPSLMPSAQFAIAGLKEGDFVRVYCRHSESGPADGKAVYITHANGLVPQPGSAERVLWEGVLDLHDDAVTLSFPEILTLMLKPGGVIKAYFGAVFNDYWNVSLYSSDRTLVKRASGTSASACVELELTETIVSGLSGSIMLTGNGVIGMITYSAPSAE